MDEAKKALEMLVLKYRHNMEQLPEEDIAGRYAGAFKKLKQEIRSKAYQLLLLSVNITDTTKVGQQEAFCFQLALTEVKKFVDKMLFRYYEPELLYSFLEYFKRSYAVRLKETQTVAEMINFPIELEEDDKEEDNE